MGIRLAIDHYSAWLIMYTPLQIMIVEELAERGDLRKYLLSISPSDSDSEYVIIYSTIMYTDNYHSGLAMSVHLMVLPQCCSSSPNKWLLGCSTSLLKVLYTETWLLGISY